MTHRLTLRTFLLISMLGLGLAPVLLLVAALLPGAAATYREAALQYTLVRGEAQVRELTRRTERRRETVRNIAMLPAPLEVLRAVQGSGAGLYLNVQQAAERFAAVMGRWFTPSADVKALAILDLKGVAHLRLEELAGALVKVTPATEPFAPALAVMPLLQRQTSAEPMARLVTRDVLVRFFAPIRAIDGVQAGVLVMDFDLRDLLGGDDDTLWIDGHGNYVGSRLASPAGQGFADYPSLAPDDAAAVVLTNDRDPMAWVRLDLGGGRESVLWVGSRVDAPPLRDSLHRLGWSAGGIAAAWLLVLVVAVRWSVTRLVRAKQHLVTGLQRIVNGEDAVHFDWGGPSEMRDLAHELTQLGQLHANALKTLRLTQFSVDHAAVGILWITPDGIILFANDAAAGILGYHRPELIGVFAGTLFRRRGEDLWWEHWRALQAQSHMAFESRLLRRDGTTVPVDVAANYLLFEGQEYDLAFITDIHERKQVEQRLQQSVEELTRLNIELERFTFIASHDLQEPVRTVVSFAQLLERRLAERLDTHDRENLEFLVEGAKRMQALVKGLLEYSVVTHSGEALAPVDCRQAVTAALIHLQGEVDRTAARIEVGPLPTVWGDAVQMQELFKQLLSNALKFSRSGSAPDIHVSAERQDGQWMVSIADNGVGIAPEYRPQLFIVFRRLHGMAYPGIGVGLAVCRRIVERHGGRIWVDSAEGGGSIFRFTLPAMVTQPETMSVS